MTPRNWDQQDLDLLVERVARREDGAAAELLELFFAGLPVEELLPLLRSEDDAIVRAGAWIASELGDSASPIIDDLADLLQHRLRYVRFYAIDSILTTAGPGDGEVLARVASAIADGDHAVRWKVLWFLSRATPDQLAAAADALDADLHRYVRWLLDDGEAARQVLERLESRIPLEQLFAAAAAARLVPRDPEPLAHAAASSNEEVRSFARGAIGS